MKIVFLLSRVPWPLDKGDKLRAFYQLMQLSENHDITLIALTDTKVDENAETVLAKYCKEIFILHLGRVSQIYNILRSFFIGLPLQSGYFYSRRLHKRIRHIVNSRKPDVVFFQLVRMASYADGIESRKVLDYQDALSEGLKRRFSTTKGLFGLILRIEYKRMVRYEKKVFGIFDRKIIITKADREFIQHRDKEKIVVIPNGIDTIKFHAMDIPKTHDIIFAGNMNYPPNVDAAVFLSNEVMPFVRKKMPETKLMLAGANPAYNVSILSSDYVTVTGWVNDMALTYNSAKVFIAPMRIGTGLQNKLLEAMATGLPAITTPLANNALGAAPNTEILIGETAEELANHIVKLLSDSSLRNRIADAGKEFVLKNYSWKEVGRQMENILKPSPISI